MTYLFMTLGAFSSFPSAKRATGIGEALAMRGHRVFIVAMDCHENRDRLLRESPHCHAVFFQKTNAVAEGIRKVVLTRRIRPDYVYSLSYSLRNMAFMRPFLPWGVKSIIEFNELYSNFSNHHLSWVIREFFAIVENGYVLCASKYLEGYFRNKAKFWHLSRRFLYLPFAYPTYLRGTVDKADGRHHVVFMAHMGRGYGVFDVLKAFEWVSRLKPKSHLDLIGGGPDLEEVRHWVATHGLYSRISVYGYVREEELDGLFSCAAAFVAPLHDSVQDWARCPSKVFYYIPYNKPIVTCRIGDPFENLKQYAIYYSADDVDDMARAIITALERSVEFAYPCGFIETHSWNARAKEFERWTENE